MQTRSHDITHARTTSHTLARHHTRSHDITHARTTSHTLARHHTRSHDITHARTTSHTLARHHTRSHDITHARTTSHTLAPTRLQSSGLVSKVILQGKDSFAKGSGAPRGATDAVVTEGAKLGGVDDGDGASERTFVVGSEGIFGGSPMAE